MDRIIECVPNFSEGRDENIIMEITADIKSAGKIKILDIFSGKSTNRTVVTFAGEPEHVIEAAFRGIEKAAQLIDMTKHKGKHPRFGATDVCPLIPLHGISMEETADLARKLAARVGNELDIPVYCYEYAAFTDERLNLTNCRSGGYEGLKDKITCRRWKPDFGPSGWSPKVAKTGAVAIGARNLLIAYNINLDTDSIKIASSIAADIRESGGLKHKVSQRNENEIKKAVDDLNFGTKEKNKDNLRKEGQDISQISQNKKEEPVTIPGSLQKVRAIGWYLEEYGIAQVSMNLTDISITPLHKAFEEVCRKACERGVSVTGSEIVGLIPLQSMLDAGKYFLHKQGQPEDISEEEIIKVAIDKLGLNDLHPFDPKEKIIEFLI